MKIKSRSNTNFNSCPECNSLNSIIYNEDRAEQTCNECGFVLKERMFDTSIADERYFTKEEMNRRARSGPPIPNHLSKFALPTKIDHTNNREQDRIFKKNVWSTENLANIQYALAQIYRICGKLQLSDGITRNAEKLTIQALDKGLARGRSIIGIVAASIFYSCKGKINLAYAEIVKEIEDSIDGGKKLKKHVHKCYRSMFQELHLSPKQSTPLAYIPRFITDLGLDQKCITLTTKFYLKYAPYINMNGKDPRGIAAAAIYITCRAYHPFSQKKIAKIAGITDVTLRSRMRDFEAVLSR